MGQALLGALGGIHYLRPSRRKPQKILGNILRTSRHMRKMEPDTSALELLALGMLVNV